MTDIELNRRNLIAAAGLAAAGTALAGCDLIGGSEPKVAAISPKEVAGLLGEFVQDRGINNYGHNPNDAPIGPTVPFNPQYMAVIHMTSRGPWAINSNLAHFAFADQDKSKRIDHAGAILLNKLTKNHKRFRDAGRGNAFSPFDRRPGDARPEFADFLEFAEFDFLHQHDLYVFYEHKPGEVLFDPNQLVTFSQYQFGGAQADENHAFFNAEVIDPAQTGQLAGKGSLIRLENHYTVWNGSQYELIGPEGQVLGAALDKSYKMNLIYVAGSSGLPVLIDPDPGNGMGGTP